MRPGPTPAHAAEHERWRRIEARLSALEHAPATAPLVDADPPEDSPVRLWRMSDGRLRWRDAAGGVHQASESTPGPPTSTPALPTTSLAPTTHTLTVGAAWVVSFGPGAPVAAGEFGQGVRCMIGLGDVAADLVGAEFIDAVRVRLFNLEGETDPVRAGIGWHAHTQAPPAYAGSDPVSRVDLPRIGSPGWRRISRTIGTHLARDGGGLVIDQAATGQESGRIATDNGRAPRVQITYRA